MIGAVVVCILVAIAGSVALAELVVEGGPGPALRMARGFKTPSLVVRTVATEREFAAALDWRWRTWLAVRTVVLLVALTAAWALRVPAVVAIAVAIGAVGPRLILASRAERRRIREARAFIVLLRHFASHIAALSTTFEAALADAARNAPPELGFLTAAAAARDITAAFCAAITKAKSPLLERGMVTLLISRTRDHRLLGRLLSEHEIPQLEGEIDEAEEIRAMKASQNATIVILAGALCFMFAFLNGVPTLHDFYSSAAGSVALLVVVCVFFASVVAMKLMLRQPRPLHWNLDLVLRDLVMGTSAVAASGPMGGQQRG